MPVSNYAVKGNNGLLVEYTGSLENLLRYNVLDLQAILRLGRISVCPNCGWCRTGFASGCSGGTCPPERGSVMVWATDMQELLYVARALGLEIPPGLNPPAFVIPIPGGEGTGENRRETVKLLEKEIKKWRKEPERAIILPVPISVQDIPSAEEVLAGPKETVEPQPGYRKLRG